MASLDDNHNVGMKDRLMFQFFIVPVSVCKS